MHHINKNKHCFSLTLSISLNEEKEAMCLPLAFEGFGTWWFSSLHVRVCPRENWKFVFVGGSCCLVESKEDNP